MSKKIVFFYPAKNVGGAQILFARIGEYLYRNNFNIVNIDFGESFISDYFEELNIVFNHIVINNEVEFKSKLPDDSVLIVSLSSIALINKYFSFSNRNKVILWDLHPNNLIDHTVFSYFYKKGYLNLLQDLMKYIERKRLSKIKVMLDKANEKNGLLFMCRRNFLTNSDFFGLSFQPSYLPIPQPRYKYNYKDILHINDSTEINIGWLSRLEKDKVDILNLLILDLESYYLNHSKKKINLHIIGIGSASENILISKCIRIIKAERLIGDELTEYINTRLDLGFAMGTSALEFASRRLATILVPSSTLHTEFKDIDNKYIWLHDVNGFDVATEVYHQKQAMTIKDILSSIKLRGIDFFNKNSYEYLLNNHSIEVIGDDLIETISKSEFYFYNIEESGFYEHDFFESTLLFIKNKTKKLVDGIKR